MSEAIIVLSDSYATYELVLAFAATIYVALFVATSNHYVLKPKIEHYLQRSLLSSALLQFLIDLLSNLTHLTLILSSILLLRDDNVLSVMIYSDMHWCGIMLAMISFKGLLLRE